VPAGSDAAWNIEMNNGCGSKQSVPGDLTGSKAAFFFWCLPIALVVAGGAWNQARVWLWAPAFAIAGLGCLINAARCGRIHCYLTGPLFLGASVFVVLSGVGVVKLHPGLFLLIIVALSCFAGCAEIPFGKYRSRA
jgi:hypothetical protein